jgi:hypothetical protein
VSFKSHFFELLTAHVAAAEVRDQLLHEASGGLPIPPFDFRESLPFFSFLTVFVSQTQGISLISTFEFLLQTG